MGGVDGKQRQSRIITSSGVFAFSESPCKYVPKLTQVHVCGRHKERELTLVPLGDFIFKCDVLSTSAPY